MAARKLFDPASNKPFALSRSKIELFQDCPRCFYLDRRLGIAQLGDWRNNFRGARTVHEQSNFELFGAIDEKAVRAGISPA